MRCTKHGHTSQYNAVHFNITANLNNEHLNEYLSDSVSYLCKGRIYDGAVVLGCIILQMSLKEGPLSVYIIDLYRPLLSGKRNAANLNREYTFHTGGIHTLETHKLEP